jgi:hypothetical protein
MQLRTLIDLALPLSEIHTIVQQGNEVGVTDAQESIASATIWYDSDGRMHVVQVQSS